MAFKVGDVVVDCIADLYEDHPHLVLNVNIIMGEDAEDFQVKYINWKGDIHYSRLSKIDVSHKLTNQTFKYLYA